MLLRAIFCVFYIQFSQVNALPMKFEVTGPGLDPSVVLPARYFFIKPLDATGKM